ncbi:protein of unknown function [Cupriavidus taiwanensis]|nr:protein of unknown function [Cupriavidus taiwanensis]
MLKDLMRQRRITKFSHFFAAKMQHNSSLTA